MGVIVKLVGQISDALDITSVVVSHDVHDVVAVADYSYVISDGQVAAAGTPEELNNSSSEVVKQFMHGLPDGPVGFHYDAPDYAKQLLGESPD
jgi:phospholipid/cholesterol/gamma-HCH transport system ATP-binding protein